jgi:hypothetical protein
MSWIPFHCQFKSVVKQNWTDREKDIHLLAIMQESHGIPTNAKYEANAEVLEGHMN